LFLPPQDVAYSLTTTLESDLLTDMDSFVDFYCQRLSYKLAGTSFRLPEGFRSHFDICWLDYARVILSGLWKRLDEKLVMV
jgi:hypothetical protein